MRITLDHLASKWNRSKESLHRDVKRSVEAGVDVISVTEVADGKRHEALQWDGWTTCQDRTPWQAGECAIMVRDSFGDVLYWETVQIGPDLGPGNAVFATIAVIKHKGTGVRVLVADSHLPSSVQDKWTLRRGLAYRVMVSRYRRAVNRVRKAWGTDVEVVWADWNMDLFKRWIRAWITAAWRSHHPLGPAKAPRRGTHGDRWIDWPLTRKLKNRRFIVLDQTPGSDHRGVRLSGRVKR